MALETHVIETYEQAVAFWQSRINYEKIGMPQDVRALKLDRMRLLLELMGNPQEPCKVIHITGTKGKGSTATLLASVLRASGYRTGLYTSPHLLMVEERIQVNGRVISREELTRCMNLVAQACEQVERQDSPPTFFEIITAVGWVHFAQRQVDWAVVEVGLGGRFDATNVCRPEVAVITSISLDHMEQLGNTTEAIAFEKAGIIKENRPVVVGVREPGPLTVIEQVARERQAPLYCLGREFDFDWRPGDPAAEQWPQVCVTQGQYRTAWLPLPLWGQHQAENAAVAVATVQVLREQGLHLSEEQLAQGFRATKNPGRLEIVKRRPWLIVDCAHNVASVERLVEWVHTIPVRRRWLLWAVSKDKQIPEMLQQLRGVFEGVCFTRYGSSARGALPEDLLQLWHSLGGENGWVKEPATTAWQELKARATAEDLIVASGSVFLAGEIRAAELPGA